MSKTHRCPACQEEVDRAAVVCSNPACRRDLAFCSHCRDVSTYSLVAKGEGAFVRDVLRCDRCQRPGVRCVTWTAGGYCNGLARAGGRLAQPLCANCLEHLGGVGRTVAIGLLTGVVTGLLRRKP